MQHGRALAVVRSAARRSRRSVGSIIGWARPRVYAVVAEVGHLVPADPAISARLLAQRAAGEQPAQQARPRAAGARSDAGHDGHAGHRHAERAQGVLDGRGQVVLRRRRAARTRTGVASRRAADAVRSPTSGAGGLDTTTISSVAGSASSACRAWSVERPLISADRSRPPTPSTWLTPDAGLVEQAHHLLRAGAGGGDEADRPGPDGVGEAEPDAADDGRAAVGAHDEQAEPRGASP